MLPKAHGAAHIFDCRLRNLIHLLCSIIDDFFDKPFFILKRFTTLANRIEKFVQSKSEFFFYLYISHRPFSVTPLQIFHLIPSEIENIVINKDGIALDCTGDIGTYPIGVGIHSFDFLLDGFGVI